MMWIIIGLAVIVTVGIILKWTTMTCSIMSDVGAGCVILGGITLLFVIGSVPASYYGICGKIAEFEAARASYERARDSGNWVENAAIQSDIAERNGWLARKQYWNSTTLDIFIPDEIDNLEPIK